MIRPLAPTDNANVLALLETTGLFDPAGLDEVSKLLADYFGGGINNDHCWIIDDDADGMMGVAYYAPERMTDGTWNLYLIAVNGDHQGKGRGSALIRHVEQALATRGERLLLVETSGLESFERTRVFYRRCGYEEEARIRDFYSAGEDKIVYRKVLSGLRPSL